MDSKSNVRNILRAIIGLGRSLRLPITAEGVETGVDPILSPSPWIGTGRFIFSLDCTEAQGYHFGRPVPATEVAAIILRNFTETSTAMAANVTDLERNFKLVR